MEEELMNITEEQFEELYSIEECTIAPQDHTLQEALKNEIKTERGVDDETSDENIQED